jgi:hypothetical protein
MGITRNPEHGYIAHFENDDVGSMHDKVEIGSNNGMEYDQRDSLERTKQSYAEDNNYNAIYMGINDAGVGMSPDQAIEMGKSLVSMGWFIKGELNDKLNEVTHPQVDTTQHNHMRDNYRHFDCVCGASFDVDMSKFTEGCDVYCPYCENSVHSVPEDDGEE